MLAVYKLCRTPSDLKLSQSKSSKSNSWDKRQPQKLSKLKNAWKPPQMKSELTEIWTRRSPGMDDQLVKFSRGFEIWSGANSRPTDLVRIKCHLTEKCLGNPSYGVQIQRNYRGWFEQGGRPDWFRETGIYGSRVGPTTDAADKRAEKVNWWLTI